MLLQERFNVTWRGAGGESRQPDAVKPSEILNLPLTPKATAPLGNSFL
jgi:hypothetical protein